LLRFTEEAAVVLLPGVNWLWLGLEGRLVGALDGLTYPDLFGPATPEGLLADIPFGRDAAGGFSFEAESLFAKLVVLLLEVGIPEETLLFDTILHIRVSWFLKLLDWPVPE
jgi:hypothetical protein